MEKFDEPKESPPEKGEITLGKKKVPLKKKWVLRVKKNRGPCLVEKKSELRSVEGGVAFFLHQLGETSRSTGSRKIDVEAKLLSLQLRIREKARGGRRHRLRKKEPLATPVRFRSLRL